MTHKATFIATGILAVAIAFFGLLFILVSGQRAAHANPYSATNIGTASTTATFSVTTSARILATSTPNPLGGRYTRVYSTICTASAIPVALALNGDSIVGPSNITTLIGAAAGYNSCFEISDRNAYQGSVTASSTTGAAAIVNVSDYFQ